MGRPGLLATSFLCFSLLVPCSGCGGGKDGEPDTVTDTPEDPALDGEDGQDMEPDAEVAALDVLVERLLPYTPPSEKTPVIGALVALDTPSGVRLEGVTDENGLVSFEGHLWGEGTSATLTAYSEEAEMVTHVGLTESYVESQLGDDRAFHVVMCDPRMTTGTVEVGGTLLNMGAPTHQHTVYCSLGGHHQGEGDLWSLDLPTGLEFQLLAMEWDDGGTGGALQTFYSWQLLESPGVTGPTVLDIDMADSLASATFSGTMTRPEWAPGTAVPYVEVFTDADPRSWLYLGAMTRRDWDTARDVADYEVHHADPGPGVAMRTRAMWLDSTYQLLSGVLVDGTDGGEPPAFIAPPTLVSPTPGSGPIGPGDEVRWTLGADDAADETIMTFVLVLSPTEGESWSTVIWAPHGVNSVVLPDPPSGVDATLVYPEGAMGMVNPCRPSSKYDTWCDADSVSGRFRIGP